ncbi:MAG: prepilin-type N-terminal cleavage/methylation domain-containing protein [Candidatus Babeliaceae bacterium]
MNKVQVSRGFSLFEIMIVLAVLMIILFCAFFYQTSVDQFIARTELDTLYMVFMALSNKAQLKHHDIILTFDPTKHTYHYENKEHQLAPYTLFGYQEYAQGPPSQPTHLLAQPITFGSNQVIFYADGTIKSGTVYLTDKNHQVTYALSCPIAQISYLRRYVYDHNSWVLLT